MTSSAGKLINQGKFIKVVQGFSRRKEHHTILRTILTAIRGTTLINATTVIAVAPSA